MDRNTLVLRLKSLGAEDQGDHFEVNTTLDTADGKLAAKGELLRLRTDRHCELTFKGPVEKSTYKQREEINISLPETEGMSLLLNRLGFITTWYYEKYRHRFTFRGCEVALDKLPGLGCFIEVEGASQEEITSVLHELEIDPSLHEPRSYLKLFSDHCRQNGVPLREMRF